jgi:hypothetical protein
MTDTPKKYMLSQEEIDLRDKFAMHALAALIAEPIVEDYSNLWERLTKDHNPKHGVEHRYADAAYTLAWAMLEARRRNLEAEEE